MEDFEALEPLTCEVQIDGTKFILREHPASVGRKYLELLDNIQIEKADSEDFGMAKILQESQDRLLALTRLILPDATEEFLHDSLPLSVVWQLIRLQNSLNGLDELLKKAALRLARDEKQ